MSVQIHVLGIRHHGPGSARMVRAALATLKPDAVLIEGPPDAADVLPLAAHKDMQPPVALLIYDPEQPGDAVYYPFATFSPEWQAIRWSLERKKEVRFIDLPRSLRPKPNPASPVEPDSSEAPQPPQPPQPPKPRTDPLDALAHAAGYSDGEAWWGRVIEEQHAEYNPLALFDAIRDAMAAARATLAPEDRDPDEAPREAHMRRAIRAAIKDGFERIAVVCGAWHASVLTTDALEAHPAKADDAILKPLAKHRTEATWIPWTSDRLSASSGYGAGVTSPGWYDHLWLQHEGLTERWLTKVARLMRDEDLDASPAGVVEAVRLAEILATIRGRSAPGLDELGDATLTTLCHGNPLPMRVIERKLIVGDRLGEVPDDVPTVPLQRDLAALQKSLRLKPTADDTLLDLDQRKELDLNRSRLLHRLAVLSIPWGTLQDDQRQRTSTFHEIWKLQWKPELAVAVMEAARWGNTVEQAATARVHHLAEHAAALSELTTLLGHVMLADLPRAVERVVARIQHLSAVGTDLGHLLDALPPLASVMRYGNVRGTAAALLEPVVAGLLARIGAGLLPACASLDDDAASTMRGRINAVHTALTTLARDDFRDTWLAQLTKLAHADLHGLVTGRAWRLLLDAAATDADHAATQFSLALSRGNDPAKASAWIDGFLGGSGLLLIHDQRLLAIVDTWVSSLARDTFEHICPILRRTFSTFERPERRQIGEKLARANTAHQAPAAPGPDDYDPERGALVEPVLRLILGELT
jgi:hypothetical protein